MNTTTTSLASLLERFFTQRLIQQRQASPHTISSYRDTFRLLLKFTEQRLHTPPSRLAFEILDAPLIAAFLDHLEKHRGLSARSRNLRLTTIHSFFRYAAFEAPAHAAQIQRVLAIPASASRGPRFIFCYVRKSRPCSLRPIKALGSADAITPSSCWPCSRGSVDRADMRRRHPRYRCACSCDWEGPQRTMRPSGQTYGRRVESLAPRTATRGRADPVPQRPRNPPQPRRRPLPVGQACQGRRPGLPLVERETRHRPSTSPHHGPRSAARGRGSLGYCPVAGARIGGNNSDLSGGHLGDEGESARENPAVERQIQTLSTWGPAPWLPQ